MVQSIYISIYIYIYTIMFYETTYYMHGKQHTYKNNVL